MLFYLCMPTGLRFAQIRGSKMRRNEYLRHSSGTFRIRSIFDARSAAITDSNKGLYKPLCCYTGKPTPFAPRGLTAPSVSLV